MNWTLNNIWIILVSLNFFLAPFVALYIAMDQEDKISRNRVTSKLLWYILFSTLLLVLNIVLMSFGFLKCLTCN